MFRRNSGWRDAKSAAVLAEVRRGGTVGPAQSAPARPAVLEAAVAKGVGAVNLPPIGARVTILASVFGREGQTATVSKLRSRFYQHVLQRDEDSCWEWLGSLTAQGYGQLRVDGEHFYAHRASYLIHRGPIPNGLFVCHTCDNRSCANPGHLFLGTNLDNMQDMKAKGRAVTGERHPSSKLTEPEVREILRLRQSGQRNVDIANRFGVSQRLVRGIVSGEKWAHISRPPSANTELPEASHG